MAEVVEYLPSKFEAWSSNPSTDQKKRKKMPEMHPRTVLEAMGLQQV
jgi:hypothetical protein